MLANAAGVFTFHADPGALSAAFVAERLARVYSLPSGARFVRAGWTRLIDALAGHACGLGVRIHPGSRIDRLPSAPVVVATELRTAARLLADDSLRAHGTTAVLLDVGLRTRRWDPYVVGDLDGGAWVERFTSKDRSLCPPGHQLIQAHAGLRPGESQSHGIDRLHAVLDAGYPGWSGRVTWTRHARVTDLTGAIDRPGRTWQHRAAVGRGDGIYLAGDMVAAPGLLGEVAVTSAIAAGRGAAGELAGLSSGSAGRGRARRGPVAPGSSRAAVP